MKCLGHISFQNYILYYRNEAYFRAIMIFFFFFTLYSLYIFITVMTKILNTVMKIILSEHKPFNQHKLNAVQDIP